MFSKYFLVGAVAGFFSAFLGIGAGIVLTPALVYLKVDFKKAVLTSLVAVFVVSIFATGSNLFISTKSVNWFFVLFILLGALVGAFAGAKILKRLSIRYLRILFAVFLFFISSQLLGISNFVFKFGSDFNWFLLLFAGFFGGIVTSLFGVGGGSVFVPFLNMLGVNMHDAISTSLTSVIGTSLFCFFFNKNIVKLDFTILKTIIPACIIGAIVGAVVSWDFSPEVLKVFFGVSLLLIATKLILDSRLESSPQSFKF